MLGLDDFSIYIYIYICTGVALHNLIGRFKHAQRDRLRPVPVRLFNRDSKRNVRETE